MVLVLFSCSSKQKVYQQPLSMEITKIGENINIPNVL